MFACCYQAPEASFEAVPTRPALGQDGFGDNTEELMALYDAASKANPAVGKQLSYGRHDDNSSVSTGLINADIDGGYGSSRQITPSACGSGGSGKLERFPRWNADDMPKRQMSFEPGQTVGYQGFSGVMVRQVSPLSAGEQMVQISIPGIGDKELPTKALMNEDTAAARARRELEMDGMSQEQRMSAQVRAFVESAQQDMHIHLVDQGSRLLSQTLFRLDREMTTMTLRRALCEEETFSLKDLKSVAKGESFKKKVPELSQVSGQCLLLEFGDSPELCHCLFFQDTKDRDEFHTCMKVIRTMARK